jgi:hypothetical protein
MPLALINGKLFEFRHIPKTGGTSVELYMKSKGRLLLVGSSPSAWARSTPQHMPAFVAEEWFPTHQVDFRFTIVRDPLERLLSTFRMRARPPKLGLRRMARAMVFDPSLIVRREPLFHIHMPNRRLEAVTFDRWVRHVLAERRRTPFVYDNHISPQVDFLSEGQKVFRFEQGLGQVFRWIDEVTGTPAVAQLHRKKSPEIEVPVREETRDRVRQAYAEDYAFLDTLPVSEDNATADVPPAGTDRQDTHVTVQTGQQAN